MAGPYCPEIKLRKIFYGFFIYLGFKIRIVTSVRKILALGQTDAEEAALLWARDNGLETDRPVAISAVPQQLLTTYDRLRERLSGVAVARLTGGRCDGCHLSLPAMELDRIRRQPAGSLENCEQCGRILVITGP